MSEKKSKAKAKTSLPKATPQSPKRRHRQRKKTSGGSKTATISGTLQFKNLVSRNLSGGSSVDNVDKVTTDPFEDELVTQMARRTDRCVYQLTAGQIAKMSTHAKDVISADSDIPLRLCWRHPAQFSLQEGSTLADYADVRGQFVRILKTDIKLTNFSPVEIKFRGNTPKAVMDQPFDVSLRSHEFAHNVPSKGSLKHRISWTNGKRDSPHYTPAMTGMKKDAVSLLDAYGLMPDIDPEANQAWDEKTTVLEIEAIVHYEVETTAPVGSKMVNEDPFTLLTLGNYYNMFHVDNEVTGLFSGASRRQLLTTGSYIVGIGLFSEPFKIRGRNVPAGQYYLLYQTEQNTQTGVSTALIAGAVQDAIICLPTSQLGYCQKNGSDYDIAAFNLAYNVGSTKVTINKTTFSGSQVWVLATSEGYPAQVFQFTGTSPAKTLVTDTAQILGNSLTVNYWPTFGQNGVTGTSERDVMLHMKSMQQVGVSLMAVIAVIEAISAIVNVVKSTAKALRKSS